ncbi:hypothetical protein PTTG_10757, partial [Puccinia triticina 1-1 BBBD Race 1]|uniref:Uncharacterized protein n=1 Tax=Puccinia triticina (isolate 1-1 / race 1 (BBBD)) TaxID=630390 RepID=A0A0C4FC06_PUCT1
KVVLPCPSASSPPSNEDLDQLFLREIYKRFQKLTTSEKPNYIKDFTRLLDQSHWLTPLKEPVKQPHKGRPKGALNKSKPTLERSTKRDPSAWEYQLPKKKVGRPKKVKGSKEAPKRKRGRPRKTAAKPTRTCRKKKAKIASDTESEVLDESDNDSEQFLDESATLPCDPVAIVT